MAEKSPIEPPEPSPADADELRAFLTDPASYGLSSGKVETIETHAAHVFLAGNKAYKIKKPVTLPFLDFSTAAQRKHALTREFELNCPHAPGIYVEIASVNRNPSGNLTFAAGDPVEPVLVMKRFDQKDLLARVAEKEPLTRQTARALALMVADYHRALEPLPDRKGAEIMREIAGQLADELKDAAPPGRGPLMEECADLLCKEVERVAPLLDERAEAGYIRRCHGDLHLRNIVFLDGKPTPFDALEFNEAFATTDVLYDLAFLLMDLDVRGQSGAANTVLNTYVEAEPAGGEVEGLATLPLFLATRAAVRGVVNLERARQEAGGAERDDDFAHAVAYAEAAKRYLTPPPPQLIAVGGLSGTGKSTLSVALAPLVGGAPGALILRTDVERKRMFGVPETMPLSRAHYSQDVSAIVYGRLYDKARRALKAGHTVIFDGVSSKLEERDAIADIARAAARPFHGLWLEAPVDVKVARVGTRREDASDSDETVVRAQATRDLGPIGWTRLNAGRTPEDTLRQAKITLGLDGP